MKTLAVVTMFYLPGTAVACRCSIGMQRLARLPIRGFGILSGDDSSDGDDRVNTVAVVCYQDEKRGQGK
jgi:hypothetical protein